jgi:hypothetical protein
LSLAPRLETVGPALQARIGHGVSHFEIGQPEFMKAIRLLERARQDALRRGFSGP